MPTTDPASERSKRTVTPTAAISTAALVLSIVCLVRCANPTNDLAVRTAVGNSALVLSAHSVSAPVRLLLFLSAVQQSLLLLPASAMSASVSRPAARLTGKRALVTGAGRGIGRAIALILAEEGADVAISSRTLSDLEATRKLALQRRRDDVDRDEPACVAAASRFSVYVADCTNKTEVHQMVDSIVDAWGGLDILVNNAGSSAAKGPAETLDGDDLMQVLRTNVVGPHTVASAVVSRAFAQSSGDSHKDENDTSDDDDGERKKEDTFDRLRYVINVSSRAGKMGLPGMSFYVASKFGLEGLTATWATEWKEKGIVVHSISPGMVDTQSFPKKPGRPGVRTAESIRDGLLLLLSPHPVNTSDGAVSTQSQSFRTGCYLHVDELDQARAQGVPDTHAMKPIDEAAFDP